jgi:protein-L-isoaspartate O-methyltransferase
MLMTGFSGTQSREYFSALASELQHEPGRIHGVAARRGELDQLVNTACEFARGVRLLELACGIGFWTRHFARVANSVHATDLVPEAVAIARTQVTASNVRFGIQDAGQVSLETANYDKVFAGFLVSHIPRGYLRPFFGQLNEVLQPGTGVMLVDNAHADRTLRPIHSIDAEGNTYERRQLRSVGSEFRILKNYYSDAELVSAAACGSIDMKVERSRYYWLLMYTVGPANNLQKCQFHP